MSTAEMEGRLEEKIRFLAKYSWVYDFKMTRFFLEQVWTSLPEEWAEYFTSLSDSELNDIPFGLYTNDLPESLRMFVDNAVSLSFPRTQIKDAMVVQSSEIEPEIQRGITPKKLHEVCHMAALVDHMTRQTGCDVIVDVGSGLGYLGQILHSQFDLSVVGLESKSCHAVGAQCRSNRISDCACLHNTVLELSTHTETVDKFTEVLKDWKQKDAECSCIGHTKLKTVRNKTECTVTRTSNVECIVACGSDTAHEVCCRGGDNVKTFESMNSSNGKNKLTFKHDIQREINELSDNACRSSFSNFDKSNLACKCDDQNKITEMSTKSALHELHTETGNVTCSNKMDEVPVRFNKDTHPSCSSSEDKSDDSSKDDIPSDICKLSKNIEDNICNSIEDSCNSNDKIRNSNDKIPPNLCNTNLTEDTPRIAFSSEEDIPLDSCSSSGAIPSVLMIGLHCCGDLTPTMIQYFCSLPYIKGLCCVSCCYHRMQLSESTQGVQNFPFSKSVHKVFGEILKDYPGFQLSTYGLRLAAQETRARWKSQTSVEHDFHTRNVAFRAVLEMCLERGGYRLKKQVRKLAHKSDFQSWDKYVKSVSQHIQFDSQVAVEKFPHDMNTLYHEHRHLFQYIEPFTMLQVMLQPVLESLIYLDRQLYLQEAGFHSTVLPLFDEYVSPRNLALVVIKDRI